MMQAKIVVRDPGLGPTDFWLPFNERWWQIVLAVDNETPRNLQWRRDPT